MKGVILSLPARNKQKSSSRDFSAEAFVKKNLSSILFTLCYTVGVVWGACISVGAEDEFLSRMDFLFTTNLDTRLSMGMFSCFAAHFASNFIFFAAAVLCGLSIWGVGVLPFVVAFKGFGTGLTAGYLISAYGLKGIGFYIAVVLPGAFVFSLALVFMSSDCSLMSIRLARSLFSKNRSTVPVFMYLKGYFFRCTWFLFLSALGALCDMVFWSFVSRLFF